MYVGSGEILYDTQQSEFYKRETRNSCKISNKINNSFISCIRNLWKKGERLLVKQKKKKYNLKKKL